MAKEARDALIKGDGTCSNRRSGSKKLGAETENGATKKGSLCNGDRLRKELLCL